MNQKINILLFVLFSLLFTNFCSKKKTTKPTSSQGAVALPDDETDLSVPDANALGAGDLDYEANGLNVGTEEDPVIAPSIEVAGDTNAIVSSEVTVTSSTGETRTYTVCEAATTIPTDNPCTTSGGTCTMTTSACTATECGEKKTMTLEVGEAKTFDPNNLTTGEDQLTYYFYAEQAKIALAEEFIEKSKTFKASYPDPNVFEESEQDFVKKIYAVSTSPACTVVSTFQSLAEGIIAISDPNTQSPSSFDPDHFKMDLDEICEDETLSDDDDETGNPNLRYGHVVYLESQKGIDTIRYLEITPDSDAKDCEKSQYCVSASKDTISENDTSNFEPQKLWQVLPGKDDLTSKKGDNVGHDDEIRLKNLYYNKDLIDPNMQEDPNSHKTLDYSDMGYSWLDTNGTGCEGLTNKQERQCVSASKEKDRNEDSGTWKLQYGFSYKDKMRVNLNPVKDTGDAIQYQDRIYLENMKDGDGTETNYYLDVQGKDCEDGNDCVSAGYFNESFMNDKLANWGNLDGDLTLDDHIYDKFESHQWLLKSPCFSTKESLWTEGQLAAFWTGVGVVVAGAIVGITYGIVKAFQKADGKFKTLHTSLKLEAQFMNGLDKFAELQSKPFDKTKPKDVGKYLNALKSKGLSDDAIGKYLRAVKIANPKVAGLDEAFSEAFNKKLDYDKATKNVAKAFRIIGGVLTLGISEIFIRGFRNMDKMRALKNTAQVLTDVKAFDKATVDARLDPVDSTNADAVIARKKALLDAFQSKSKVGFFDRINLDKLDVSTKSVNVSGKVKWGLVGSTETAALTTLTTEVDELLAQVLAIQASQEKAGFSVSNQ